MMQGWWRPEHHFPSGKVGEGRPRRGLLLVGCEPPPVHSQSPSCPHRSQSHSCYYPPSDSRAKGYLSSIQRMLQFCSIPLSFKYIDLDEMDSLGFFTCGWSQGEALAAALSSLALQTPRAVGRPPLLDTWEAAPWREGSRVSPSPQRSGVRTLRLRASACSDWLLLHLENVGVICRH